ncbi:NUDIX domain-containing protein [Candidatus Dojkabacteria bacterium]|nr:NUDIX domain-containing protein [Candidatus Dojkabacteria bacterium]
MADLSVFYKNDVSTGKYKIKTLCYLRRVNNRGETEYLLGKHYKQGKWNGFGGKVGDKAEFKNETIEESLEREGLEEFGIKVIKPQKRGIILFVFYDEAGQENKVLCHLFFADQYEGEITASEEMLSPTWFTLGDMPWEEMWPNDRIWLEEVLKRDQFLKADFKFDPAKGLIASKTKMEWSPMPKKSY